MSFITLAKTIAPSAPTDADILKYADQNGVLHSLDSSGVDTVIGNRQSYNWLENAGFWFAQRQAPASLTTYSSTSSRAIAADRWAISNETASAQYRRVDTTSSPETGLQSKYYGEFTKITNNGKLLISQLTESNILTEIRGRTVRLQVKLKGVATTIQKTWRIGLVAITSNGTVGSTGATFISSWGAAGVDPTLGANLAYISPKRDTFGENCALDKNGGTCEVTSSWQRFSAIFDVPMDCQNVIVMIWNHDTVVTTNGVAIGEASLTLGLEPQIWSPQDYAIEMHRVQRFYQKTFAIDTAPAQNLGTNNGHLDQIEGKSGNGTALAVQFNWRLPVLMIASGTVTTYNPSAANAQVRNIAAASDFSSTTTTISNRNIRITASSANGMAVGDQCGVHVTQDSEMI